MKEVVVEVDCNGRKKEIHGFSFLRGRDRITENFDRAMENAFFIVADALPFSSTNIYLSNGPQVSMVYKLINHSGCW